ncbi:pentatricopeptide repeat-containing protein At1g76280 isoform X1 [Salvia hispanica]|uniref:pentatricopeptide repeat-containing protein At1g76280 isoform X1 n=1 Tax=Salvia hispanica TaxID=49212 RepID=UPI002009D0E4|nr:pentatricopeptide repeat-containing protein At1g76280 isoform X1 [Salvia hispanica]
MLVKRLLFRLKCTNNSFREWKAFDTIQGKEEAVFVQGGRFFGTSNDGYLLTKPIARKLGEEVINALHSGQRSRASNLLTELGSGDRASEVHSFLPILQFCASAPDPLFAMETWKLMVEKDVKLSGKCYLFTIKALCKGGYLDEAFSILGVQRAHAEICPTLQVYNCLLKASVQMNSLNHANEVLYLMEQEGMLKDIITYSQLLKLAVLQQNLSAVHEIWKDCIKYYSLSIITLRKFVWAFTRLKDLESAYMALQKMVAAASQHKFSTTATYEQMLCISRLDVPIPFSGDLAWDRYTRSSGTSVSYSPVYNKENDSTKGARFGMQETGVAHAAISLSEQPFSGPVIKLLMCSFDDIISSCAHSRNIMFAEQLMLQMRVLGLEPSSRTYNGYIRALVSVKTFHDGMEVLNIMRQKNMKPSDSTLAALSVSCSRGLQLDLAETFLDQVSKCNHVNIFNEFLKACDTVDKPERAIRVWARMKDKNLKPDIRTYELLFSLFGSVNAPYDNPNLVSQADAAKRIKAIEMDMTRHGIQHNLFSLQNLLKALGREKMINELIQYIRVAEEQCVYRNTNLGVQIYNTFLHSLVEAKESHVAIEIFKKMISCGLSPNLSTYGIMIDCCSIINCYTSACALISRMIRDGLPMNVVIYTGLVKILSRSEAFNEAFRLLDLAITEAIQPDLLLYNAILKIASQKGKIGVLELIVEKMHRLKIRPDPSTCRHVFSAYADNGFHSTAMEALQVMSLRMISEEDDILEEYRLKYENLILDEESDAESEIVAVFKDSPDLVVSLLNLKWYAILVSPPSWLPDQSPWAKRLSSNYTARLSG